jgi:hypothetical protein
VARTDPSLDRPERVLDRLAALTHGLWVLVREPLDSLEHRTFGPPTGPSLPAAPYDAPGASIVCFGSNIRPITWGNSMAEYSQHRTFAHSARGRARWCQLPMLGYLVFGLEPRQAVRAFLLASAIASRGAVLP